MSDTSEPLSIEVKAIPADEHRYPTCGDWAWTHVDCDGMPPLGHVVTDFNDLRVRVTAMGDWRYEALVAVHEIVETLACRAAGVDPAAVDAFDVAFEAQREAGGVGPDAEPGMDPKAPYHRQHVFADAIERLLARELGVDWEAYNTAVMES
jgi:hypothetical protein